MSARDKLEFSLARELGRCIGDFDLVNEGDRIRVDPVEGRYMERAK